MTIGPEIGKQEHPGQSKLFPVSYDAAVQAVYTYTGENRPVLEDTSYRDILRQASPILPDMIDRLSAYCPVFSYISSAPMARSPMPITLPEYARGFLFFYTAAQIHADATGIPFPEIEINDANRLVKKDVVSGTDDPTLYRDVLTTFGHLPILGLRQEGSDIDATSFDNEVAKLVFDSSTAANMILLDKYENAQLTGQRIRVRAFRPSESGCFAAVKDLSKSTKNHGSILDSMGQIVGAVDAKGVLEIAARRNV